MSTISQIKADVDKMEQRLNAIKGGDAMLEATLAGALDTFEKRVGKAIEVFGAEMVAAGDVFRQAMQNAQAERAAAMDAAIEAEAA